MRNNTASSIRATVASYYSYWMKILKSLDATFNKQEYIAISLMLFCLNHGNSEHKQKADVHGNSYWSMATFMTSHSESLPPSWITHSRPAIATNAHAWYCMLLNGVAGHDSSPPWAGFLQEDHLRQSGPSMAAIVNPARWSGGPAIANPHPEQTTLTGKGWEKISLVPRPRLACGVWGRD